MPWKNFTIWRGRLPHWRADDVTYYVIFRHSRPLEEDERHTLFVEVLRSNSKRIDLLILCVLPERTELLFTVRDDPSGQAYELADVVEKAKIRAGKKIVKKTGERFPPFFHESFDRIVRDEIELQDRWDAILGSPVASELCEDPDDYPCLWVCGAV